MIERILAMDKINVQVFGIKNDRVDYGCSISNKCGCGAHKCGGCINENYESLTDRQKAGKTMGDSFEELVEFIRNSDVGEKTHLEFIDVNKLGEIHPYNDIIDFRDRGFNLPITVVDGIVRYYGGISGKLIYKDIKELLL